MNRDDIQKLLGGYATGTLSDSERRALFAAAVEDQSLFDALADEAALKELLDDPEARAYLLEALPAKPKLVAGRSPAWRWAAAGSIAAVVLVGVFLLRGPAPRNPSPPQLMARASQPPTRYEAPPGAPAPPAEKQKMLLRDESSATIRVLKDAPVPIATGASASSQLVDPALSKAEVVLRSKYQKADATSAPEENRELAASATGSVSGAKLSAPAAPLSEQRVEVDAFRAASGVETGGALDRDVKKSALALDKEKRKLASSADSISPALQQQQGAPQPTKVGQQSESVVVTANAPPAAVGAGGFQQGARQIFYGATLGGPQSAASQAKLARAAKRVDAPGAAPGIRYKVLRLAAGGFVEVDPSAVFRTGDALRLNVETNSAGYLAVWDGDTALASLRVIARTTYTIPPEGAIQLSAPPGEKNLLVTFSRQPETKPLSLATGLLVEQSPENAIYVAGALPAAPVSFSITLAYR